MAQVTFNKVVSRLKSAIRLRIRKGNTTVSALDIRNVMRTSSNNSARGAAVKRAFTDLVEEGILTATTKTVYNSDTHHGVTVYQIQ